MNKSIWNAIEREFLLHRLPNLKSDSTRNWGKMTVEQMLEHCLLFDQMMTGKITYKRSLMGRIFGRSVLNEFIKDDRELPKNTGTISGLIQFNKEASFDVLLSQVHLAIESFSNVESITVVHPFFGSMNRNEIGILVFKHYDHHLRQFGV